MTPKFQAMSIQKRRRLFYDLVTLDVLGVASGGGALQTLSGDALLIATFNDPDAPSKYGLVEEYYTPIPPRRPIKIKPGMDIDLVNAARASAQENEIPDALQTLMERLEDSIEYQGPDGP